MGTNRHIGDNREDDIMLRATLDRRRRALGEQVAREFEDARIVVERAQQLVSDPRTLEPVGKEPTADELHEAERVININSEMVYSHFFERGVRASATVARISRRDATGNVAPEGTGSLIGPRLLMTNNHVIKDKATAKRSLAEFFYDLDVTGSDRASVRWTVDPSAFFATDKVLDITVVGVVPPDDAASQHEADVGHTALTEATSALVVGEFVNVVQHPDGQRKQVAFRENRLLDRKKEVLWYEADTMPGSSGAPVYNDQWVLVALHRRAIPRRNGEAVLNKDGTVHDSSQSDDEVDWIANEGVQVGAIRAWLRDLVLEGEHAGVRDKVLAAGADG